MRIELFVRGRKRQWWLRDVYFGSTPVGVFTLLPPTTRTLLSWEGPVRVSLPWTAVGDAAHDTSRKVAFFDEEPREGRDAIARHARYHSLALGDHHAAHTFNVCCGAYGDFWNTTFRVSARMLQRHLVGDERFIVMVREIRGEELSQLEARVARRNALRDYIWLPVHRGLREPLYE